VDPPRHSHKLAPDDVIRRKVKAELRKRLRGLRATTPADACAARSAKLVLRLAALPCVLEAKAVALFWPIVEKHEVDLRALDTALRARGVRIAYPVIDPTTRDMSFRFAASPAELAERGFGFLEPLPDAPMAARGDLDVVVVPAIAISPDGHRIGYGAGFYDRTLPSVAPPAVTVGVAFDFQLLAEVPATEGDVPVDVVVTDARELMVAPPAPPAP
jgi:5-formyltetrahydrofolate cyclo-ligase